MPREYIIIYTIENISFAIDEDNIIKIKKELEKIKLELFGIQKRYFDLIANEKCTKDKYSNENYKEGIKNVTALKFKGKNKNNARIYCKDFQKENERIIILCEFHKKNKQKF